jgi:hypothetical protein
MTPPLANGVLLKRAMVRGGFARVEDLDIMRIGQIHEFLGSRGNPGELLEIVQGHPFPGENGLGGTGEFKDGFVGFNVIAVLGPGANRQRIGFEMGGHPREKFKDPLEKGKSGKDPTLSGDNTTLDGAFGFGEGFRGYIPVHGVLTKACQEMIVVIGRVKVTRHRKDPH